MRNVSARRFAIGTVVLAGSPASRALFRMVEIGERRVEVSPERRALEVAFALGMEPGVEALQVDAGASDGPVAVKAVGAGARPQKGTVVTASCVPVAGEAIAAAAPPADGRADHVNKSGRHGGILNG
jgi:hypothetical protein